MSDILTKKVLDQYENLDIKQVANGCKICPDSCKKKCRQGCRRNGRNVCRNKRNKTLPEKCCTYSFVTKNPFDIAISKEYAPNHFLVLLSGNTHSNPPDNKSELPHWVKVANRPCRDYKSTNTKELVDLWTLNNNPCGDICYAERSYDVCHPNGYLNYYLTNGTNRSQVVEILHANLDESTNDPTLVLNVKLLSKSDDGENLDGLQTNMFRVSLVIDSIINKDHSTRSKSDVTIAYPPAAAFNNNYQAGATSNIMGPNTVDSSKNTTQDTTTTQTTIAQQQQQQQQQMGDGKQKKHNHSCKHKCRKEKNKKKKKECEKKCKKKKEEKNSENDDDKDNSNNTTRNTLKKKKD